jgi:hypothetical protein
MRSRLRERCEFTAVSRVGQFFVRLEVIANIKCDVVVGGVATSDGAEEGVPVTTLAAEGDVGVELLLAIAWRGHGIGVAFWILPDPGFPPFRVISPLPIVLLVGVVVTGAVLVSLPPGLTLR